MLNFDYLKNIPELSELHRLCDLCEQRQSTEPDSSAIIFVKKLLKLVNRGSRGDRSGEGKRGGAEKHRSHVEF